MQTAVREKKAQKHLNMLISVIVHYISEEANELLEENET
jgi:hypothetical protein